MLEWLEFILSGCVCVCVCVNDNWLAMKQKGALKLIIIMNTYTSDACFYSTKRFITHPICQTVPYLYLYLIITISSVWLVSDWWTLPPVNLQRHMRGRSIRTMTSDCDVCLLFYYCTIITIITFTVTILALLFWE